MSVKDFIKKSVLEGFSPYNVPQMAGALLAALAMGVLIYWVYQRFYAGVIFSRSFAMTLVGMSVLTCMVTLAISSNVVISLGYRVGPAEHTGLFCVNVRALSSLADISSSKAWNMNFVLHSFAVRFFFSKRSFDTTSPSMLRIATSPCRRGLGSPHRVSGFARDSPTRRAVERERD